MTRVIEEEYALFEHRVYFVLSNRITLSAGIHLLRISVKEHFRDDEVRVLQTNEFCTRLCRFCMRTSFTIVGKVHDTVFPFARILIVHVANNLIDHLLRLFGCTNRQSSYTDIHGSGGIIIAFGVIQETEIVVGGVAFHFVEGVLCLVGKQQGRTGVRQQFAVIERTMSHQ